MKKSELIYQVPYTLYCWFEGISLWVTMYLFLFVLTVGSDRKEAIYNISSRYIAKWIVKLAGVNVKIVGAENVPRDEALIFMSNHQSFFDIKLALAFVPNNFSFISKESVFHVPLVGRFMRTAGHVSLKRDAGRKAYDTMSATVEKLNSGKSLVVFPEGTRSPDGRLGKFKRGVSLLLLQSGKRVIPMAIIGSGKFLAKGSAFFDIFHREVTVKFGKPMTFEKRDKVGREEINTIVESLRERVSGLLLEDR